MDRPRPTKRASPVKQPAPQHFQELEKEHGTCGPDSQSTTSSYIAKLQGSRFPINGTELWVDGLLCAYELYPATKKTMKIGGKFGQKSGLLKGNFNAKITLNEPHRLDGRVPSPEGNSDVPKISAEDSQGRTFHPEPGTGIEGEGALNESITPHFSEPRLLNEHANLWVPIGWARIGELVTLVQMNLETEGNVDDLGSEDDDSLSVADQAAPYWQSAAGPAWWCHVNAANPRICAWLSNADWLHPSISAALRDESRLISERMKHLYYEVPVRVGGGLLFELLGQSVGDAIHFEDDVPVVLRSWTAQKYLITVLHPKGYIPRLNVLGITEVQDIVAAGGTKAPHTTHEIISLLADRLARWDDRLYRKHYFGAADEVELKFVSRKENEDLAVLSIILNQEIRRLSSQVIRVKWSLHAREEIMYELMAHLKGGKTQSTLAQIRKSTREMLGEQEAARDRLFTVQDVMQSTVRAWLQDKSVRIQHNLAVIGGGGLFLSIIVGLFGINVAGIPGENTPHAFAIFTGIFILVGASLIGLGILYLGFKKLPTEEQLASRKMELQDLVKTFQKAAEAHEKVKDMGSGRGQQGRFQLNTDVADYILMT